MGNEISQEQFKLDHLRKRVAAMTIRHEDEMTQAAVTIQILIQDRDAARAEVQSLAGQLAELKAELERLKEPCEEEPCFPEEGEDELEPTRLNSVN